MLKNSESQAISIVDPMSVYNLPLFESYLVIDCRSKQCYEKSHISTSFNFPPLGNEDENKKDLITSKYLNQLEYIGAQPEHYSPIILYGDDTPEIEEHVKWLSNRLSIISSKPLPNIESDESSFCKRLADAKIWVIKGGYTAFQKEFPILCGLNKEADMLPLPCMIAPHLFLGSRSVTSPERREENRLALDRDVLRGLGIECVVINGNADLRIEDTEGLQCLLCPTKDDNSEPMHNVWRTAILFIEQSRSQNKSVLIQFYGRSRGAALATAWAMESLHLSWNQALQYVTEKCYYKLDTSLMYLDQLKDFNMKTIQ